MATLEQQLEDLLLTTLKLNASDLHLNAGYRPTVRINGALVPLSDFSILTPEESANLAFLLLGDRKPDFLERKELDFSYGFKDKARFRINTYFEKGFGHFFGRQICYG